MAVQRNWKGNGGYAKSAIHHINPTSMHDHGFGEIIGQSVAIGDVCRHVLQAAATEANVIIVGESGTGKELVARAIHEEGARSGAELVAVNCGAIPENLLESEFFGRRKGAFSGASSDTHGYLDLADGGTLFLDEVGELSLEMQVKLLRAIEGGGYYPVGSNQLRRSNFRLITATNRNVREMVGKGLMREDFYYRVHILVIPLPPLRERKEDIPLLLDHYLKKFSGPLVRPALTTDLLEAIHRHNWPGNIRELQNVIRRYLATGRLDIIPVAKGESAAEPVAGPSNNRPNGQSLAELVEEYETKIIKETLENNQWHRGRTAASLGIDRRTLYTKMKSAGML